MDVDRHVGERRAPDVRGEFDEEILALLALGLLRLDRRVVGVLE